ERATGHKRVPPFRERGSEESAAPKDVCGRGGRDFLVGPRGGRASAERGTIPAAAAETRRPREGTGRVRAVGLSSPAVFPVRGFRTPLPPPLHRERGRPWTALPPVGARLTPRKAGFTARRAYCRENVGRTLAPAPLAR